MFKSRSGAVHISSLDCTMSRNSKFFLAECLSPKSPKPHQIQFTCNGEVLTWDFETEVEAQKFHARATKELLKEF